MKAKELLPLLRLHGRTLFDEDKGTLFFNWTCGGFTARFRGKTLRARLTALSDQIPAFPGMPTPPPDFPYMGVVIDGADEPTLCRVYDQADEWATLFEGDEGEHTVRVVKLSESARGKLGLLELETARYCPSRRRTKSASRSSATPSPAASATARQTTPWSSTPPRRTAG